MIYDCFTYFNEDLILELRLNTLDKFVDKFVLVEATRDHSGKKKKLNFDSKKFLKFKDKIIYIVVDDLPITTNEFYRDGVYQHENFVRENFQRNQIVRGLKNTNDEDLIIISDVDEIPNLSNINLNKVEKCEVFFQKLFYYKFNLLNTDCLNWQGSKILKKKYLTTPQEIRNLSYKKSRFWQIKRKLKNPKVILNGGWHFSYIMSPNDIFLKINSFGHSELNSEMIDVNKIEKRINNCEDVFGRNIKFKKIHLDASFPEYILNNKSLFEKFIM